MIPRRRLWALLKREDNEQRSKNRSILFFVFASFLILVFPNALIRRTDIIVLSVQRASLENRSLFGIDDLKLEKRDHALILHRGERLCVLYEENSGLMCAVLIQDLILSHESTKLWSMVSKHRMILTQNDMSIEVF